MIISSSLCLAIALYHETRSTSIKEQIEVAQVMQNRAKVQNKNICKVVMDKHQFSWAYNFKPKYNFKNNNDMVKYYKLNDKDAFITSLGIATFNKYKFNNVLFYHDKNIKKFNWDNGQLLVVNITKNFIFYKQIKQ